MKLEKMKNYKKKIKEPIAYFSCALWMLVFVIEAFWIYTCKLRFEGFLDKNVKYLTAFLWIVKLKNIFSKRELTSHF